MKYFIRISIISSAFAFAISTAAFTSSPKQPNRAGPNCHIVQSANSENSGKSYRQISSQVIASASVPEAVIFKGEKLLYFILFLHFSAITFYKFKKRRNLTKAMVTGNDDAVPASGIDGGISVNRTYFGLFLMLFFVLAAQAITLLRPALF